MKVAGGSSRGGRWLGGVVVDEGGWREWSWMKVGGG